MAQHHVTKMMLWKNPKKLSNKNSVFCEAGQNLVISVKNFKKIYYIGELVLYSKILNCSVSGIMPGEFILRGEPLFLLNSPL